MSATPIRVYGPAGEEVADVKSNTNTKPRGLHFLHTGGGGRGASPVLYRRHSAYEEQIQGQLYNDGSTSTTSIEVYGPLEEEAVDTNVNAKKKTRGLNLLRPSGSRDASPIMNRRHSDFSGIFNNLLRPLDFVQKRKSRIRTTSEGSDRPIDFVQKIKSRMRTTSECSDNSYVRSQTPDLGIKKKNKYFTKPVEKNAWPVYQPQPRRRPTRLQTQLSCPVPSSNPKVSTPHPQMQQSHNINRSSSSSISIVSSSGDSGSDEECNTKQSRYKGQNNASKRPLGISLSVNDALPRDVAFDPNVHSYRDSSSVRYELQKSIGPRFGVENLRNESFDILPYDTDNENRYASSRVVSDNVSEATDRKQSETEVLYSIYDTILEGQLSRGQSFESEDNQTHSNDGSIEDTDHHTSAMRFRDSRGSLVMDPLPENTKQGDLDKEGINSFVKFFKYHNCFDLIPYSGKVVAFDTTLQAKEAFLGLTQNGVRAAILWDEVKKSFVGILTITDFIKILQKFYEEPNRDVEELEEQCLETWRSVLKDDRPLLSIAPDASLYEAIQMLMDHKIHRLPVMDHCTGNVLYIITHKRLMKFLYLYINELPMPLRLQQTLEQVKIGTYSNIETAREETTIIEALNKFVEHRVSALPIVDGNGKLIDIYAKNDVMNLAEEKAYKNLNVTLKEANEYRNESFEQVHCCTMSETLGTIMERIVFAGVHRLVVVDQQDKVIGVISLSDILKELVLKPCGDEDPLSLKTAKVAEMEAVLFAKQINGS